MYNGQCSLYLDAPQTRPTEEEEEHEEELGKYVTCELHLQLRGVGSLLKTGPKLTAKPGPTGAAPGGTKNHAHGAWSTGCSTDKELKYESSEYMYVASRGISLLYSIFQERSLAQGSKTCSRIVARRNSE